MFHHGHYRHHGICGFVILSLASVAMTIPFIGYMKRMASSLERIANKN